MATTENENILMMFEEINQKLDKTNLQIEKIGKQASEGAIEIDNDELIGFFVKFGADYPELESTTFRLSSSNPALPYISLFLFFNLFT